jgi:hypothetical protein
VTAVGGTSLTRSNGVYSETAWSGAGSGCSAYVPKPTWQKDTGCSRRTVADVAAVADPNTGVYVYTAGGWRQFGGTSVASPIVAAVYALAGSTVSERNSRPYATGSGSFLRDVTSGSNGRCGAPQVRYLCTAVTGYDGPTGLGTPRGVGGF